MPRKKCRVLGKYAAKAKKLKQKRKLETLQERTIRLAKARERTAKCRASETVDQRETRLQYQRERTARIRALKQERQRLSQLKEKRNKASTKQNEAQQMDRRDKATKLSASASKIMQLLDTRSQKMMHRAGLLQTAQPINKALDGFNDDSSKDFSHHSSVIFGKIEKVKEEPVDYIDECSWDTHEELEPPPPPPQSPPQFVKTEGECEIEDTFRKNIEALYGKEEELECPATVFLKSEAVAEIQEAFQKENEESWEEKAFYGNRAIQEEEDPLALSSESEFLASIRQKIGALSAGQRHHQQNEELLENS